MGDVYVDQNHHWNRILNADLTQIPPNALHPNVLAQDEIVAGIGIEVTNHPDGTVEVAAGTGSPTSFRYLFTVVDPLAQTPVIISHNLGAEVVSVTVAQLGQPSVPVQPGLTMLDPNTIELLLSGEPIGEYEALIIAGGGEGLVGPVGPTGPAGGGLERPTADALYVNIDGDSMTGDLNIAGRLNVVTPDSASIGNTVARIDVSFAENQNSVTLTGDRITAYSPAGRTYVPQHGADIVTKHYVDSALGMSPERTGEYLWGGDTGDATFQRVIVEPTGGDGYLFKINNYHTDQGSYDYSQVKAGDTIIVSAGPFKFDLTASLRFIATDDAVQMTGFGQFYWLIPANIVPAGTVPAFPFIDQPVRITTALTSGGGAGGGGASVPSSFRQLFTVTDPLAQIPVVITHNLGAEVVSVTVAQVGDPSIPIQPAVTLIDGNSLELLLSGEPSGQYEVLVLAGGGEGMVGPIGPTGPAGGGLDQATADALYVNVTGDEMLGTLMVGDVWVQTDGITMGEDVSIFPTGIGDTHILSDSIFLAGQQSTVVTSAALKLRSDNPIIVERGSTGVPQRITNVADPTGPTDVVTKAYFDAGSDGKLDQATADTLFVNVTGDTMIGSLHFASEADIVMDGTGRNAILFPNAEISSDGGLGSLTLSSRLGGTGDMNFNAAGAMTFANTDGTGTGRFLFTDGQVDVDGNRIIGVADGAAVTDAVNKGQMDAAIAAGGGLTQATADGLYVDVVGDTMTGPLTLSADPAAPLQASTKQYVDSRIWFGTQAQYDAIVTKDSTVLYCVGV